MVAVDSQLEDSISIESANLDTGDNSGARYSHSLNAGLIQEPAKQLSDLCRVCGSNRHATNTQMAACRGERQ